MCELHILKEKNKLVLHDGRTDGRTTAKVIKKLRNEIIKIKRGSVSKVKLGTEVQINLFPGLYLSREQGSLGGHTSQNYAENETYDREQNLRTIYVYI